MKKNSQFFEQKKKIKIFDLREKFLILEDMALYISLFVHQSCIKFMEDEILL